MSDTYPKSAKLTDELVRRLPCTTKGQAKIRDDECKGLLLVIGMETKTFSAKVERVVSGIREFAYESFGSFDPEAPDHVGVKEARKAAGKWIADYQEWGQGGSQTWRHHAQGGMGALQGPPRGEGSLGIHHRLVRRIY